LLILRLLVIYRSGVLFILLSFTNYYFIVLLTGAERLKIAFILIVIAATIKNKSIKYLTALLTPLAHTQMIAHIAAIAAQGIAKTRIPTKINKKTFLFGATSVTLILAITYLISTTFGQIIMAKLAYYSEGGVNLGSLIRLLAILLTGLFALKTKSEFVWSILAISFFTAITGSDRFQISAMAILAYNAVKQGCTRNYAVIMIMVFFSYKSIDFLYYTYNYGHGFANVRESTQN
jgi:hypothetical protein